MVHRRLTAGALALACTTVEGVRTLAFDRPASLNAIDGATHQALSDALEAAELDDSVRVVVLRGVGAHFSAGADIKEPIPAPEALLGQPVAALPTAILMRMRKPTIAAIRGYCLGGGLETALAADFRIAAEGAMLAFSEIEWGLTTGWGGGILLRRLAGRAVALDLLLTGRRFGADEALRLGVVGEVVGEDGFEARVAALARRLADQPPVAVRAYKQVLRDEAFEGELAREISAFATASSSPEARERLAGFAQRRR